MVISVLSAVGVFAMRSASLVDVAAGYNRQGVQAAMLADFAARGTASYMSRGDDFITKVANSRTTGCARSFLAANAKASCTVIDGQSLFQDFTQGQDQLLGKLALNPSGVTSVQGAIATEVLVPSAAAALSRPGFEGTQFKQLTVTAIAHVFPGGGAMTSSCTAGAREALTQQSVRAHVIIPQFTK